MAFWPFGRKKSKRSRRSLKQSSAASDRAPENISEKPQEGESSRDVTGSTMVSATSSGAPLGQESGRRRRNAPRKLSKEPRNPSRGDRSPPTARAGTAPMAIPSRRTPEVTNEKASYGSPSGADSRAQPAHEAQGRAPPYTYHHTMSQSSIQQEHFTALPQHPTLRAKRNSGQDSALPRRKSSKRKAEDFAREQNIKALSSMPKSKRAATRSSEPLRRDTKKIPGGLNKHLDRPTSDVSLPLADSMRSSTSADGSESTPFKVNALDVFSPRPTIRYAENPRDPLRSLNQSRTSTRSKKPLVPEEKLKDLKEHKRIDDLADHMDAGSLRELMERDKRRKEKKRQLDQDKLQRKLERRARREQEEEDRRRGREKEKKPEDVSVGLGIGGAEAAPESTLPLQQPTQRELETPDIQGSWLRDPSREHEQLENPFEDQNAVRSSSRGQKPSPIEESPVVGKATKDQSSPIGMSPPTSPVRKPRDIPSVSQFSNLQREGTRDAQESYETDSRRTSDTSGRQMSAWTSFFRRSGTRSKRRSNERYGRGTPSEFSNTSRESFASRGPPPVIAPRTFRRSGTPVRTTSKFKEDLPDFPISPPDSRVQSPDVPSTIASSSFQPERRSSGLDERISTIPSSRASRDPFADQIEPNSRHRSLDPDPDPAMLSRSLASVDSEGSWLSGRPSKRISSPLVQPFRESVASLQAHSPDHRDSNVLEEDDVAADEYFSRLTPDPYHHRDSGVARKPSSTAIRMDSDEEDEESEPPTVPSPEEQTKLYGGVARKPTIVRQQQGRIKSREGLLNEYRSNEHTQSTYGVIEGGEGEESSPIDLDSPDSPRGSQFVQRAKSVDLKRGHARHMSAGSAKLLDIGPRSSRDLKRSSGAYSESSGHRMSGVEQGERHE